MDLWHLNNMKVGTLNNVHYVPFSCTDSFHIVNNRANWFKKIIFSNSEKHEQTSINLTNVFDFIG